MSNTDSLVAGDFCQTKLASINGIGVAASNAVAILFRDLGKKSCSREHDSRQTVRAFAHELP